MASDIRDMTPIGIDFGSRCVKLAQFRHNGQRLRLSAVRVIDLPAEALFGSREPRTDAARSIRRAIAECGFAGNRAVTNLPNELFEYCNFRISSKRRNEAAAQTQEQAAKQMGLEPSEVYCQHFEPAVISDGGDDQLDITSMAAHTSGLHQYLRFLTSCGLTPVAVDVCPSSLIQWLNLLADDREDQTRLLLSIGNRWTTIVITSGTEPRLVRRVPIGLVSIDTTAANAISVEVDLATRLRTQLIAEAPDGDTAGGTHHPALDPEDVRKSFHEAANETVQRICQEVDRCVQYFTMTHRCHRPDSGMLVGGGAAQLGIPDALQRASGIVLSDIDLISSGPVIDLTIPGEASPPASLWAEAAGLALYHESAAGVREAA